MSLFAVAKSSSRPLGYAKKSTVDCTSCSIRRLHSDTSHAVSAGVSKDLPNYPPSAWLQKVKWPLPTLADSDNAVAAQAFGLNAYPFFSVVNASGKLALRATGELDTAHLAQLVELAKS